MTTAATFEDFRAAALAQGFDEVLVREWRPGQLVEAHTHPFELRVQVVRGDMALTCEGQTRHFGAGSAFELARGTPHAEQYGPEGATFWVARRNAA